jgi:hypothetical protein
MCFNKDCGNHYKTIRRADLEGRFEALLASVQPSAKMYALTLDLFRRAWDQQSARLREVKEGLRRRVVELEKQSAALLDRIVEATNPTVIARYEQRIDELERERLIAAEKLEAKAGKRKSFDEVFKLTLGLLANPCEYWEKGTIAQRHTVLKLTFADRLSYSREKGILNPKMSVIFRTLDKLSPPKGALAERVGFESQGNVGSMKWWLASAHHLAHQLGDGRAGLGFGHTPSQSGSVPSILTRFPRRHCGFPRHLRVPWTAPRSPIILSR